MVDYRRSEIVSGLFIVLAVLVFALFALKVGSFDLFAPFRGDVVSCRAYLHDIKTLEKGAKVTVGGRTVGSCTGHGFVSREMRLEDLSDLVDLLGKGVDLPEKLTLQIVEVRFELDDPELRLDPETASVSLAQDGFLGTHYLRLHPGHWTAGNAPARLLEAGIDDLVITAHDAAGIDGLLAQLQPILAQVGGILTKTNEQFLSKSNMEAATNLLGELDRATRSLRQLLDSEQPKGLWKSLLEPA
ncbi:MAG: MlaD family protein, partial [Planctomycetota bacterium]